MPKTTKNEQPSQSKIWRIERAYCVGDMPWLGRPSRADAEHLKTAQQYGY